MSSIRVEETPPASEIPIPTMPTIETGSMFDDLDYVEIVLIVCLFVSLYQSLARTCIKLCSKSKEA